MKKELLICVTTLVLLAVGLSGCTHEKDNEQGKSVLDKLIGTWMAESSVISFFSDSTYSSTDNNGTFEISDEKLILYNENVPDFYEFEYTFSDNDNTLTLRNLADGEIDILTHEVGFTTYENAEYSFKIRYPTTWFKQEELLSNTIVTFAVDPGILESLSGSLSITVADTGSMSIEAIKDSHIENISMLFTDINISYDDSTTLAGESAYELIYTYRQGVSTIKQREIWTIKDDTLYFLTYIVEEKDYDMYVNNIEQMINSFEIL